MAIEKLLGQETLDLAKERLGLKQNPTKKQLGWYLAEACASGDSAALPQSASKKLLLILNFFQRLFESQHLEIN